MSESFPSPNQNLVSSRQSCHALFPKQRGPSTVLGETSSSCRPPSAAGTQIGVRDFLLNPTASVFFPRRCDAQDGARWWGRAQR